MCRWAINRKIDRFTNVSHRKAVSYVEKTYILSLVMVVIMTLSITTSKSASLIVKAGANNGVKQILAAYTSAAIKEDGSLWMWGSNSDGQIGDGTTTDRLSPVEIKLGEDTDPSSDETDDSSDVNMNIVPENGETSFEPGETVPLKLDGAEGYDAVWKVDDESLATIISEGNEALLTFSDNSSGKTVTVIATLKKGKTKIILQLRLLAKPGQVSSVSVSGGKSIKVGQSVTVSASVNFKNNRRNKSSTGVTWVCRGKGKKISETPNSYKVKATGKGIIKVTATSKGKPYKKSTCVITVR